jgi:hypothetical protein
MELMYGGFTQYFTRIAIDALKEEIVCRGKIDSLRKDEPNNYSTLFELHCRWLSSFLTCIVFSAFALESYINGYGVRRLSAKYYKEYLDRLSLESKVVVVPKLVAGRSILGTRAHALVKKVIRARNRLAHDKPKHMKDYEREDVETVMTYLNGGRDLAKQITAYEAIQALVELNEALREIDEESAVFPIVDSYFTNVWAEINES